MTESPTPAPAGIDPSIPNAARIYDYYLGGKDNFESDRLAVDKLVQVAPLVIEAARANREFLRRAIRFLAESGIRQFIDIGGGLPTQENVHEIAQRTNPDSRVIYVDYDPVVTVHGLALLAKTENVWMVQADLRDWNAILDNPLIQQKIDFTEPVGVLFVAVLHFVADHESPDASVAAFKDAMAPGSHLVISHASPAEATPEQLAKATAVYSTASAPFVPRTRDRIMRFFDGVELLPPGLVYVPAWRPYQPVTPADASKLGIVGGVARKL